MFTEWLGIDRAYMHIYPWVAENKETGKYHFSRQKIIRFFEAMFNIEEKEIKYLKNPRALLRKNEKPESFSDAINGKKNQHSEGKKKGAKREWYLRKFQCPEDKIKSIDEVFRKLEYREILILPENFNILNYFSVKRENKDKKTLREHIIDWTVPDDLAGLVAFVEILEDEYNVKTEPSQVRATFQRCSKDTGSYETYKGSKMTTNSYDKRNKIDERKSQLKKYSN